MLLSFGQTIKHEVYIFFFPYLQTKACSLADPALISVKHSITETISNQEFHFTISFALKLFVFYDTVGVFGQGPVVLGVSLTISLFYICWMATTY